jgi:putative inorganic carbon (HCO3(-)) transporter
MRTGDLSLAFHDFRRQPLLQQLVWLEPLWLLLLAPLLLLSDRLFSPAWMPAVILLFFVGWPLRLRARGHLSVRTPLDLSLLLYVLWIPAAVWVSDNWLLSWQSVGYLAFGVALYVAIVNWPPARRQPAWTLLFFLPMVVGLGLLGPILLSDRPVKLFRLPEFQLPFQSLATALGETVNPNVLAGTLLLGIPLLATLALWGRWATVSWLRPLCALLALFLLTLVVLTQSRGAYAGVLAGLGVVLWLRWPRLGYGLPVLVLGAGGLLWFDLGTLWASVDGNLFLLRANERVDIWVRAYYALIDFPLTGIGIGTHGDVIPVFYPYTHNVAGGIPHAHNLWLQVGVDLGGPGLVAYLAILINLFFILIRVYRSSPSMQRRMLAAGTLASLAAMQVHGITDAVTWGTKLSFIPWTLFALGALLAEPTRRRRRRSVGHQTQPTSKAPFDPLPKGR